jgi:hypothetical protein
MNRELISKLYAKAVDYCVEQGPNPDGTNKAWLWEEKFAELIVQECAELVQGCLGDFEVSEGEWIEREASDIILDHFEVA